MQRISSWAGSRPQLALGLWVAAVAALAILGHGVGKHLEPTSARIDGSTSATAGALSAAHFADSSTLPILLTGPSKQVRSQGHKLANRLTRLDGVNVLSPWNDRAHLALLRPRADRVLILVSVTGTEHEQQEAAVEVRGLARGFATTPVDVRITGVPLVAQDLRSASIDAAGKADLIALPLLLLVLLLVFRSFIAAAVPVAFGAATVLASGGAIRLLTGFTEVDAFATGLASMMGLALAVDYSLLIVSRFRDERRDGADVEAAIATASRTSAHVVAVAGLAVVVAMVLAASLAAGQAVASAVLGVAAAAVLAMGGAALALPAILALLGDRLTATTPAEDHPSRWAALSTLVLRRPALAAGLTAAGLLVIALPALSQNPSGPDVRQLPKSSSARADFEAITAAVGPGWGAGFDVVSVAKTGTMTTPARLEALAALQRTIERDPDVAVVLGPGPLAEKAAKLRRSGRELLKTQKVLQAAVPKQKEQLKGLDSSVGSASGGVKELQGAFDDAAGSATRLSQGGGKLKSGVGQLSSGLDAATAGARTLDQKVGKATAGSGAIKAAVRGARTTAQDLATSLQAVGRGEAKVPPAIRGFQAHNEANAKVLRAARDAAGSQRSEALAQIANARRLLLASKQTVASLAALSALSKAQATLQSDPVSSLTAAADQLDADARTAGQLATAVSSIGFHDLAEKARTLASALSVAERNQGAVEKGVQQLVASIGGLKAGLEKLGGGTAELSGGLAALDSGLARLQSGATAGKARTRTLAEGLAGARSALAGVTKESGSSPQESGTDGSARGVIASGYFILAALDAESGGTGGAGSPTGLDVDRGGQASRIIVIPLTGPNDPRTRALGERLAAAAARFSQATDTESAVGGPAAVLSDYQRATSGRLLTIVLALALATALLLAIVLRSIPVAVMGVALNLLAVGATLGILDHLFTGEDPLLGGPGQLDATALTAVFAVMFALATDYQVFVVTRIREELAAGRSPREAVAAGVSRTAHVVTGAALSMVAVFLAFATADVASLQQFGVGLAIAVALDATIIRLVLLPSLLALGGRGAWWPGLPAPRHEVPARRRTHRPGLAAEEG